MVKCTIGDALKGGIALLNAKSIPTAGTDARMLLQNVLECDAIFLTVHSDDLITSEQKEKYDRFLQKRSEKVPAAYIINHKEFMSIDFYVDENVLIPRPDTEVLCEEIIKLAETMPVNITDMCTGSGCIAVSLAKYISNASVTGLDISPEAVDIAYRNAKSNGVSDRCKFKVFDIRKPYPVKSDIIVSNPPYIPHGDISSLSEDVKDNEPHIALDGGVSGFDFYDAIIENLHFCLSEGGVLAFECGYDQSDSLKSRMKPFFGSVYSVKDIQGIERVVVGMDFVNKCL